MKLQALCYTPQGEWRWDSSRTPQEVISLDHALELYPKAICLPLPSDGEKYKLCGVTYESLNHILVIVTGSIAYFYELCP